MKLNLILPAMKVSLWSNANYGLFVSINQHKVNFQSARGKHATQLTKTQYKIPWFTMKWDISIATQYKCRKN